MPDHADTALIVSMVSAAFTGGGLALQGLLYYFNGARLKVELIFCYRSEFKGTLSWFGKQPRWEDWQGELNRQLGIEYAEVRVTNIGRTPVSVESVAFDLGRFPWFKRGRKTVTPMQFADSANKSLVELDLRSPQRLDAGANITASFHLWPTLGDPDDWKHRGLRGLTVRGSARAVGRRPTRSRRRRALRFKRGDLSAFRDVHVPSPEVRVYRMLWQGNYDKMVGYLPLLMHREVVKRLTEGATVKDLSDYLDEIDGQGHEHEPDWMKSHHYGLIAMQAHHAFHHTAASWLWPDDDPAGVHRGWRWRLRRALWGQGVE